MAELSAIPFSALPQASDGYTVLYENDQVCRSEKKLSELVGNKTSSFLTKEQGDSLYQEKGDYLVDDDITGKLDKSQYAVDSATFLTAHQSLDEYATMNWVEEQKYITGVDLTNYYTKSETSGANEISAALDGKEDKVFVAEYGVTTFAEIKDAYDAGKQIICKYVVNESQTKYLSLSQFVKPANIFIFTDWATRGESIYVQFTLNYDGSTGYQAISENYYTRNETSGRNELTDAFNTKQDKLTFAGTNNTITSINNSAVGGGGESNSWKQLSEDYHSSGEITGGKFCVYVGKYNTGFNDSYTMGRENYSEPGVNIGYANKINVEGLETLPGNFNFGKANIISGNPGAVNLGQYNSAFNWGVNLGEHNIGSSAGYNIGNSNNADNASINIGERNRASLGSYNIGYSNTSDSAGYTFGYNNSANNASFTIGNNNKTIRSCYVIGERNTAFNGSYTVGSGNSANAGSYIFGAKNNVQGGGLAFGITTSSFAGFVFGNKITADKGSVAIGSDITGTNGSVAIGARNYANEGSFVIGNGNRANKGTTTIGDSNTATYTDIIGNKNAINNNILNDSALSSEYYTKHINDYETISIQINNFVAGLGNSAEYAKNSFILGNTNKIISDSADYINEDNDGYVFIYGWQNSADRNYDMAIGYKSIASGGENIAIGVPFQTITRYYNDEGTLYPATGITNTLAKGYKNFALRGNVTGVSNTAINSNLTGEYIGDELGQVTNNKLINSFVSATTVKEVNYDGDHYFVTGYMLNNIIENSNALLTGQYINDNQLTNVAKLNVSAESFSYNKFYHTEKVNLTGRHINTNTFLHTNSLNIESDNICRNIILNCAETYSAKITASKIFSDNIIAKTDFATTGNSISSINENIIFNSYINGSATQKYVSWDTYNDCNFTRNFLIGSYLGNYIYNTFSFCDNSNRNSEYKLENTTRTFNFGDNTINKSENSFVFGDKNKTSAIARTFIFGTQNNINKTKLTNDTQDYVNDIFVFGNENNVIADNDNVTYPILERNRIFGIHNYIKSSEHLNDNLIVGNNNSISYNNTKPTKIAIRKNVNFPDNPYYTSELQSAAFATYRNNIFGNGNRISQCITDSLILGAGNFVFDTTVHTPSMTADYNSIYTLGVGNIAYDGSNQINIGYNNETSGHFAEAIGDGIIAKGQQLIIGKCNAIVDNTNRYSIEYDSSTSSIKNVEQSGVLFAIGNGTYDYTTGTNNYGNTVYYDKNKNVIPSANVNNEEYITRSNAFTVSANGVVSANDYYNAAGDKLSDLTEIIALLRNKPTTGTYVIKCIDGTLTWVAET